MNSGVSYTYILTPGTSISSVEKGVGELYNSSQRKMIETSIEVRNLGSMFIKSKEKVVFSKQ